MVVKVIMHGVLKAMVPLSNGKVIIQPLLQPLLHLFVYHQHKNCDKKERKKLTGERRRT